ncbi:MAG TPA: PAS domain S-box protein, partial [Solirubrobacteraceae bacterium]|nr:PAS domain S-box protein [Solirubrobacteraceae bacterium]
MKAIRAIERAGAWASSRRARESSPPIERGLRTLAAIIDSSDDAILGKTLDGSITAWNKGAEKHYGYSAQEMLGENICTLVPPDRRNEMKQILERVQRGERIDHLETVRIRKDGTPIQMSLTISPIRDGDGAIVGAATIARDISERKQADQLRFELAAIVESSDDAILGKTLDGTITSWNAAAQKLYGYCAQEIIGKNVSTLVPPDRREELAGILERIRRGERVGHLETVRIRKNGTPIEMSLTISPIRDGDGAIVGAATIVGASAIARDISQRRRMEAAVAAARDAEAEANRMKSEQVGRYRELANHDPLTGVLNRRSSSEAIERYMALAERHGQPLSLAVLDIDRFKQVNDRYGHPLGDAVLRRLAELMIETFRGEDVV